MTEQPKVDDQEAKEARVTSGIAGLDNILEGGWPAHHLYLVEGDPGTGKTTLALQFLLDGARKGESVLYITLSESKKELEGIAASHGWPLENVTLFEYAPTEESLDPKNEYSAFHPSEVEFQDTMQSILQMVDKRKPSRVVVDSLSEIRLLARDSLRYRRQILALKHYFLNRNCTVMLLDDHTADSRDQQLQSISHGVLLLEQIPRDYGIERRRLRMKKLRGSHFREGFHDYTIVRGGVCVFPRLIAGEHHPDVESGVVTGSVGNREVFSAGLPLGTTSLLTGPAGCGKSTLATSVVFSAAENGVRSVYLQFDETKSTFLTRSAAMGMKLEPHIDAMRIFVRQLDPAEVSPGEFVALVRASVEVQKAKILVIDSINGFLNAMAGEQQMLLLMHELFTYLNQSNVATLLILAQSGGPGESALAPIDVSYLADNVLWLRYFECEGEVRKGLTVIKQRQAAHDTTIREIRLEAGGLQIGRPLGAFRDVLSKVPHFTGSLADLDGAIGDADDSRR